MKKNIQNISDEFKIWRKLYKSRQAEKKTIKV